MKKNLMLLAVGAAFALNLTAQTTPSSGFTFTTVKENPITAVKNQNRSSTCWCFSGLGFIESELLRMGKGEYDFSEMFIVHHTMIDRAVNYVRLHGSSSFAPGGSFYDVLYAIKHYGLVPDANMPAGVMYGDSLPVHTEIDAVAKGYVDAIAKGKLTKLSPLWKQGLSRIYDTYLGQYPEKFTYKGKEYTPMSFAQSLGLKMDDYVSLTSFTHHPFYTEFSLAIEDNWRNARSWNLPLDEFIATIDNAIQQGYTVAWGADVSESGFTRNGIAVVPDMEGAADLSGSDMARWLGMTAAQRSQEATSKPYPEKTITPEMRQAAYDDWQTTDDHGMLIYGIAKDQTGKKYYMVKNSWGTKSQYKGIWYASEAFVRYKTINIIVNKNSIPKEITKKLK